MSSYQYNPSPSQPTPSQPAQSQSTPSTPARNVSRTRQAISPTPRRVTSNGSTRDTIARQGYSPSSTSSSSVSKEFNTTEQLVKSQNKTFNRDTGLNISTESLSFFKYVEGRGAKFSLFPEEVIFEKNFTNAKGNRGSYPQSQTARYHFVLMITPGYVAHGRKTPLTNVQIRAAHPELTEDKISLMRNTYNQNASQRRFAYPIQISGYTPNSSELDKLRGLQRELYSYTNSSRPLEYKETGKFEGVPFVRSQPQVNSPVSKVGERPPANANPGDLWFDTEGGRLFAYVRINNSTHWLEV